MPKFLIAMAAAMAIAAVPMAAQAAPCKDAKGKFVKCPPAAAVKPVAAAKVPTTKVITKSTRKAPCRDAKGKFAKCK